MNKDIEAVLDYVQDDSEWDHFRDYLREECKCGRHTVLTHADARMLAMSSDNDIIAAGILERAAMHPEENHIWAVAHRARKLLEALE
jgi:hypothetical protein|tara:strand:+ start:7240 stop:7500 length:261 start_codon:yes stop_codon:yes gene_type:complete